ncbi:MAG TPA: hypothetical protein VFH34_13270, partial [Anaerolineales bacterium]|nr:hypothetical protein [Anaerolineales bacterium]
MEPATLESNKSEFPTWRSRLWRVVRLIPVTLMLITLIALTILFLMGGLRKITAWYLLQLNPPLLGLISIIAIIIYFIVKRRYSRLLVLTTLIGLISLVP